MRCSLAFSYAPAGLFLVLLEVPAVPPGPLFKVSLTTFQDENEFIHNAVMTIERHELIVNVIADVLLTASERSFPIAWLTVEMTEAEIKGMGLKT